MWKKFFLKNILPSFRCGLSFCGREDSFMQYLTMSTAYMDQCTPMKTLHLEVSLHTVLCGWDSK